MRVVKFQEHFGQVLFEPVVRRSVVFDYATVAGVPLIFHQPRHLCAESYRNIAKEVLARA